MAPLILHNVPDDECYVGDDGVRRPYAMIFNQYCHPSAHPDHPSHQAANSSSRNDGHTGSTRSRRNVAESGSFGKSTRRSRSRTATPARGRENPTLAAADKIFGDWVSNQASTSSSSQRKGTSSKQSQSSQGQQAQDDPAAPQRVVSSSPVELILRGYRSSAQQYAALAHYEGLAGPVLEDYPRDPPTTQRRYKSELRDPAFTRRRALTPDERALVNRADGGEHWVKVTFESAEAADSAMFVSPQRVLGYLVYAEPYRGLPPAKDEACPDVDSVMNGEHERSKSMPAGLNTPHRKSVGSMPTSFSSRLLDLSPPDSRTSSQTLETATLSTATITEAPGAFGTAPNTPRATTTSQEPVTLQGEDSMFCRRIPTARRARLLPAEQALLPQQSVVQRFLNAIPLVKWFGGSMIGNEVPRTDSGEFDWDRASLYWKVIWWLDATFGLFKGDVYSVDKED